MARPQVSQPEQLAAGPKYAPCPATRAVTDAEACGGLEGAAWTKHAHHFRNTHLVIALTLVLNLLLATAGGDSHGGDTEVLLKGAAQSSELARNLRFRFAITWDTLRHTHVA